MKITLTSQEAQVQADQQVVQVKANQEVVQIQASQQAVLTTLVNIGIDAFGSGANLSVGNITSTNLTISSDTGTDAVVPAATNTAAGLATAAQITKLEGIATGATANSSDATLLNRANHTGTQAQSTITDLVTDLSNKQPLATVLTNTTASFTTALESKLSGIASGAEVNVNADWNSSSGDSQILNKPTLGTSSALDVPATGNASSIQVVKGDDTRLTDSRTPTSHTHTVGELVSIPTASLVGRYTSGTGVGETLSLGANLAASGGVLNVVGISGATNLTTSGTTTTVTINSDTGTDATIPAATASTAGVATAAQITKLDGIATAATANSSDATLLARANHTGTQLASTISDFNTAADARVVAGITGKENTITAGTTAQYWRGDKSFQTLDKTAVGLPNVDNTSDANKPVSTATQTALNLKVDSSLIGAANGVAPLDATSKIASTYLPSYVDDVLEYANLAGFPVTGEAGKIYVALDTNKCYRWSGSTYIEVSPTIGTIWGGITGTLTNQTDLQNALDSKVPTLRNLTINGVTYDLTADRSWSITAFAGYTELVQQPARAAEAITKGQAVYVSGSNGTNILVSKASNVSELGSSKTLGLANASVSANGTLSVITEGVLTGLNTLSATIGDPVWLGTEGNLLYGIANKPLAPSHLVFIGFVTRVNASNGEIFIKVQNGFELGELHNVSAPNGSSANNDGLFWESATQLWKNKSIATILGYTPLNPNRTITINGDTQDLTANRSWNVSSLKTWFDYVLGKTSMTETAVSGGVVQTLSYAGTTDKRYRFVAEPYDSSTDVIYTTFSGGVLSNPVAYKLMTL